MVEPHETRNLRPQCVHARPSDSLGFVMLNDIMIRNLAAPERGVKQYPDGKIPGFGVRVTTKRIKSFYLTYRFSGKSRRINLGRYPVTTLQKARTKAHAALVELSEGRDPRGEMEEQAPAKDFSSAVDSFIEIHCSRNNRPSTAAETARLLNVYFIPIWKHRPVIEICKTDVNAAI